MCVGPTVNGASIKPAAQQTSEGVAQASPAVWQMLATKGGTMGAVARQKLKDLDTTPQKFPAVIAAKKP